MENDKTTIITAVDRALDILIYIYKQGHPVRISDMARDMGEHKSTVYRALYTLEQKGFVIKDPVNDTYWLGMKLFAIGSAVQEKMSISSVATPYAKRLFEELQEVVNISVLEIQSVETPKIIVVHKEESDSQVLKANPGIGRFSDCHSSAAGKCLLAYAKDFDIDAIRPYLLTKYTDRTITGWELFVEEIHKVKKQGYAMDDEEREYGLTCIGAPIFDRSGYSVAAISIAGPSNRMEVGKEDKIRKVMQAAELISRQYY